MDAEKRMLIQMIRDYAPHMRWRDLTAKTMGELTTIYKTLRGY